MSQNNGQHTEETFYQESLEKITREFDPENCTVTFEDDADEEYKYVLTDLGELDQDFLKAHNLIAKWMFVAGNDTTHVSPVIPKETVAASTPEELQSHIKNKVIELAVVTLMKHKYPNG